ncbi:MAG: hypothetical protein ABT940_03450 [Alphaproteobacteria bacterium]
METVTIDTLLKYWGVNMVVVGIVVALVFATTAMLKKQLKLEGTANLIVSGIASVVWTLALLIAVPGVGVKAIIATAAISFIVASGGWQGFKDALGKVGEKVTGFQPLSNPSKREDVK